MVLLQNRLNLQKKLEEISDSKAVYFQPPPTVKMEYPCYVYELSDREERFANNHIYKGMDRYKVTRITRKPRDELYLPEYFPYCAFDRVYVADNLYHYVYDLYF